MGGLSRNRPPIRDKKNLVIDPILSLSQRPCPQNTTSGLISLSLQECKNVIFDRAQFHECFDEGKNVA
jgi:hypothetical protein